ncbi:MAG: VOC family protein [Spirochaetaceae bacterium]|jgi:lactoylglutathione lyase|nr:VOC family protein [Spirochaetaceae bacterium]
MKFAHITIHVQNLEKSLAFYHGVLGLPIVRQAPGERGPVFLGEAGQPVIELIGDTTAPAYAGFSIGLEVTSLEESTKKLEAAGYPKITGPLSPVPRVAFSFFKDPDGVDIQLVEYL